MTSMSSNNPGGAFVAQRAGVGARMTAGWSWYMELYERDDENKMGFMMGDSIDGHSRLPTWVETKDKTVLGYPVLPTDRDENYWETKYAKELYIGEERYKRKMDEIRLEMHEAVSTLRKAARWMGLDDGAKSQDQIRKEAQEAYEERIQSAKRSETKKRLDWNTFVAALESDKPLLNVAKDYRNVYDCYGVDECLDSTLSMLWLCFKMGGFIGVGQGGFRSLKTMHVDAGFLKASGIGVLTFANMSMLAGFAKWSGNMTMACAMFLMGDRMVREIKRQSLPPGVEPMRTPVNYAAGMSMSFALAGLLPWWVLNDKGMAVRLAVSSGFVGGAFGYFIGKGMQQLIALNLARLDYNPSQYRAYQAVMKREKVRVEDEMTRLRRLSKEQAQQGLMPQ